jgi:hypothetical protein
MNFMSKIGAALVLVSISILLQGCAVSVPAMAEMERGEKFIGTTTATPLGGTYNLQSLDGKFVSGTYNPWDTSTTRVFNFSISDGRTGRVIVNRTSDTSGYGIGKLSTGEKCKFTYGNTPVFMNF